MKRSNNSRFHFVYILPAFPTAPGSLESYFFAYVNHMAGCLSPVSGYSVKVNSFPL